MQTFYKQTAVKLGSIFPSLVWYATDKKKKRSNIKFKRKWILLALPGIGTQKTTTVMDPV